MRTFQHDPVNFSPNILSSFAHGKFIIQLLYVLGCFFFSLPSDDYPSPCPHFVGVFEANSLYLAGSGGKKKAVGCAWAMSAYALQF